MSTFNETIIHKLDNIPNVEIVNKIKIHYQNNKHDVINKLIMKSDYIFRLIILDPPKESIILNNTIKTIYEVIYEHDDYKDTLTNALIEYLINNYITIGDTQKIDQTKKPIDKIDINVKEVTLEWLTNLNNEITKNKNNIDDEYTTINNHSLKIFKKENDILDKRYNEYMHFIDGLVGIIENASKTSKNTNTTSITIPKHYSLGWFVFQINLMREVSSKKDVEIKYRVFQHIFQKINNDLSIDEVFYIGDSIEPSKKTMNYVKLFAIYHLLLQEKDVHLNQSTNINMRFFIKENTFNVPSNENSSLNINNTNKYFNINSKEENVPYTSLISDKNKITYKLDKKIGRMFDNTVSNNIVTSFLGIPNMLKYGKSCVLFSFGYSGTGKTANIFGFANQQNKKENSLLESIISTIKPISVTVRVKEFYGLFDKNHIVRYFDGTGRIVKEETTGITSENENEINFNNDNIADNIKTLIQHIENTRKTTNSVQTIRETSNNPNSSRSFLLISLTFKLPSLQYVSLYVFDLPGNELPHLDPNTLNWFNYYNNNYMVDGIIKYMNEDIIKTSADIPRLKLNNENILQPILYDQLLDKYRIKYQEKGFFSLIKRGDDIFVTEEYYIDTMKIYLNQNEILFYKNKTSTNENLKKYILVYKFEKNSILNILNNIKDVHEEQITGSLIFRFIDKIVKNNIKLTKNTTSNDYYINLLESSRHKNNTSVVFESSDLSESNFEIDGNNKQQKQQFVINNSFENIHDLTYDGIIAKSHEILKPECHKYFLQYAEGEYINYIIKTLSDQVFSNINLYPSRPLNSSDSNDLLQDIKNKINECKEVINFFVISNFNTNKNLIEKYKTNVNNNNTNLTNYTKYIEQTQIPILNSFKQYFEG